MNPERWRRIKEILDITLRLPPAEREAYLTRVCEDDVDLRAEVNSLLEAQEAAGDFLEKPLFREPADPVLGARLGAYQVVELIGNGGMGSVYRAVRVDQAFHKDVAIKVVQRGLDLDRVVRQFRRERQIAASLEHANIATLIDGGATAEGLPYFVMEFIRGKPITHYCDELKLKTRERLELFATVCAAVQFAHNFGVIHRDIKPGNVLVTDRGIPKLLDFGVAKILNPDLLPGTQESIGTLAGAMTPEYASPEQISGGVVTEVSDVYSLGVMLYELLAGERPRARMEAMRIAEPPPPSKIAQGRGLDRDLDAVVLMAMQHDPARRYASASAFEADVRRYLDSRPVMARKGRLPNRVAGFVSRYRPLAAILGTLAVIVAVAVIAWQLRSRAGTLPGQVIPITTMPGSESQPAFSPDGKKLVYVWSGENGGNSDIYIQNLDDGSVVRFTTDPAEDISPVWSPDGTRIAWLRTGRAETAVFVGRVSGGIHGKIADVYPIRLEAVGRQLDWSPDGEYLAVPDKPQPDEPFHIVLLRVKDGARTAVSLPPDKIIGDLSPAFSPDGKSLAFLRAVASGVEDVYVGTVHGGPAARLTADNRNALAVAWTPDGRWVVFQSDRRRNSVLWRVRASGGEPERIPGVAENAADPAFARDGRMAYAQFFQDANIWQIDSDGKQPPVKVISSTQYDSSPQYSPDGSRVAFRSNRTGSNEIWVSDSKGQTPVQLTRYGGPLTGTPRWSPDGMNLAFDTRPEGQADIYVVSSIGGAPRNLTKSEYEDVVPSWSVNGAWIYFASNRKGAWQVWRVPSAGGVEEQVTTEGGFAAFESPDGKYLYYAKGRGVAGLWRKRLPAGAEELVLEDLKPGFWGYWAVVEDGIYFANPPGPGGAGGVFFYDLATRKTRLVSRMDKAFAVTDSGFSVSPDRRSILYTQVDSSGSDIFILDRPK
ncbi:MAG: protein kinase [Candidatus Solibacter sp.]